MTEQHEDPAADIAWMRRLAEEGAGAPMQGASILMFAGLIYGTASLFHWAQISGLLDIPGLLEGVIWLIATGLFFVVLVVVINGLKRKTGVVTSGNRASSTTWSALGWGIFALFASLAVLGFRLGEEAAILALALTPSVIMVFYGIGWAVSASMYRNRVLWWLGRRVVRRRAAARGAGGPAGPISGLCRRPVPADGPARVVADAAGAGLIA